MDDWGDIEDRIRNEYSSYGSIEVASIIDKMRENRLG